MTLLNDIIDSGKQFWKGHLTKTITLILEIYKGSLA